MPEHRKKKVSCSDTGVGTWSLGVFTLVPIKNRSRAPCSGTKSERNVSQMGGCRILFVLS